MSALQSFCAMIARDLAPRVGEEPSFDPLREEFDALERAVWDRAQKARQAACAHPHPFVWTYGARAMFCPLCFWDGAA